MLPRATLIGFRASGKSTLGRRLAIAVGWPFADADAVLAEEHGETPGAMIRRLGEAAFRDAEARCLIGLLAGERPLILATGGGVVLREENRRLLRERGGLVVYLQTAPEVLQARLLRDAGDRPSLTGAGVAAEVPALLAARDPLYRETADVVISGESQTELAQRLAADLVARFRRGT